VVVDPCRARARLRTPVEDETFELAERPPLGSVPAHRRRTIPEPINVHEIDERGRLVVNGVREEVSAPEGHGQVMKQREPAAEAPRDRCVALDELPLRRTRQPEPDGSVGERHRRQRLDVEGDLQEAPELKTDDGRGVEERLKTLPLVQIQVSVLAGLATELLRKPSEQPLAPVVRDASELGKHRGSIDDLPRLAT